jgi:hypothetical protein
VGILGCVLEIGSRERKQPAPPQVVWRSLAEPRQDRARPWLDLLDDEVEPAVLEAVAPSLVVWSSLWPSRPEDTLRFDLVESGSGTSLRWSLLTVHDLPDASKIGHLRRRVNVLINEKLRLSYGQ